MTRYSQLEQYVLNYDGDDPLALLRGLERNFPDASQRARFRALGLLVERLRAAAELAAESPYKRAVRLALERGDEQAARALDAKRRAAEMRRLPKQWREPEWLVSRGGKKKRRTTKKRGGGP